MRRIARAVLTTLSCVALTTALACSKTSRATDVKDTFSRACTTDDDCDLATFGGACGFCNASNGAIAKKDRDAYNKAYNEAHENCPPSNVVGECAAAYGVSQCSPAKTCIFVSCGSMAPKDEHHCSGDGG